MYTYGLPSPRDVRRRALDFATFPASLLPPNRRLANAIGNMADNANAHSDATRRERHERDGVRPATE